MIVEILNYLKKSNSMKKMDFVVDTISFPVIISLQENRYYQIISDEHLLIYHEKKILPKWSLDKVLSLIQNSDDNSDDFLLKKSLFLTTLATGNRANEISALTRSSILIEENPSKLTISVKPKFLFKNQRLDRTPPNVVVRSLNAEVSSEKLCPVATIKEYLTRSKEWNKTDAVFCSRARGSALKSPDVSLHICRLIELACPGTIPRGHDVRKIGTSLAWCRGLSPKEIVERVFWSSSSVFISSYLSPVDSK